MSDKFDIKRFSLLLRREIRTGYKNYMAIGAFIFGLYTLIYLFSILTSKTPDGEFNGVYFFMFLIIGGSVFTSMVFMELQKPKGYHYLLLPASNFEKFLSKLLISLLGWMLTYFITFFAFYSVVNTLGLLVVGEGFPTPGIFRNDAYEVYLVYLANHSIFFLGAIFFKKRAFLYTVLAQAVISITLFYIAGLTLSILMGGENLQSLPDLFLHDEILLNRTLLIGSLSITPILWGIAYLRFKETEL